MIRKPALKRALLCGSVLSSAMLLAATAQAACLDTANGTQCVDGTSATDLVYVADNPLYVAGDFVLDLDNFQVIGGGVALSGVNGSSTVKLATGSRVVGGVPTGFFGVAGIFVDNQARGSANIELVDSSSVDGSGSGIWILSEGFDGLAGDVNVVVGTGEVTGRNGAGIFAQAFSSNVDIIC